nr:hypothetical protein BgiMline_021892 [Biomphalaria glabrata]
MPLIKALELRVTFRSSKGRGEKRQRICVSDVIDTVMLEVNGIGQCHYQVNGRHSNTLLPKKSVCDIAIMFKSDVKSYQLINVSDLHQDVTRQPVDRFQEPTTMDANDRTNKH